MRARANYPLWAATGLLAMAACLPGCGKPKQPAVSVSPPDPPAMLNNETSRAIPRRATPIIITNRLTPVQQPAAATNNTAPVVTCGAAQSLPCSSSDGAATTLTAHVEDVDGNALSVVWNIDGRDRYTQQVAAAGPPNSADLNFAYDLTAGDHVVKVSASDGTLTGTCETTVTVQRDTQAPVIACPRDFLVPPDPGQCSAVVTFSPRATDNCPDDAVTCEPPSGTAFPIGSTTVTCTATDAAGNASDCAFAVVVRITNRCPQSEVYWRQNPTAWPVASVLLGGQVYSRSQVMPLLRATVPMDASMALARQLIAANLNIANGSDPRPICGQLAQANAALAGFTGKLPFHVNVTSAAGRGMMELATRLGGYNSGLATFNCVP